MNNLQKKQLQLLNETIAYYSENPTERRCVAKSGGCFYSPKSAGKPNSEGCAIGRLLSPNKKEQLDNEDSADTSVDFMFDYLPKKVQSHGKQFLSALQQLHDGGEDNGLKYWSEKGLTEDGLKKVQEIKDLFNLVE